MITEATFVTGNHMTYELLLGTYPDGCPMVKHDAGLHEASVCSIMLRTARVDALLAVLFWVDTLRERYGPQAIVFNLPFIPGARQDRLNPEGDRLFTLLSVARAINTRNFSKVRVFDPHSDVAPGLIERCEAWGPFNLLTTQKITYDAVIAPDGGAEKRAMGVAKHLNVPLYHAWKSRNVATGQISGFGCEPIPESVQKALVVDDICDGGGTFIGLRGAVPEHVSLDLYVTHGLFTAGTEKLRKMFGRLICTDSVCDGGEGITLIPVCNLLRRTTT